MVSVTSLLDQCRHHTTIVFRNLAQWPDRVTYYEQGYPYAIIFESNFGAHKPRSYGKTVIVFTSHLDLTWDKGGGRVEILSSGSSPVSPSLGCVSTSNYACVYFGFYRLHSSHRRVREMVDVVGRLGNASK
ncbi:uncharacterized protein TNCV_3187611 [Trichonephila clavipes]|nr:uncharacterized protein TNCV_3187611 [Trichonephila clavipes]